MSTTPSRHGFYGRDKELAWLRGHFDAVAARVGDGKFVGPRMAFIVAESGIGKSRLVQELYLRLTADPHWDPPSVNYWPDAFREAGEQLRTVPDMHGHVPGGPPRFAWLGARWQPTDVRNVSERRSVLPEIRSSVTTHAEILKSHGSAWADAAGRVGEVFRDEGVGAAADAIGIPFFGLLTKVAKTAKDMVSDRMAGPKSFDRVESEEIKSEIDEVLDCMRLLLDGKGAVPTVLWLDDAQWIDAETLEFVRRLWEQAERRRWPLLIAVTHWEREWRELARARKQGDAAPSLAGLEGLPSVDMLHLEGAATAALREYLVGRLPGLTAEQQRLLVEKAGGNFLTMVENAGELLSEPMWFVDERVDGVLTEEAVAHILEFETERARRVEQRFKGLEGEVKKILGWSTQMGSRFLADVVLEFAREKALQADPAHVLEKCVDPYAVLGRPSPLTREFRDKVFHHVAREYFQKLLKGDAARLSAILRRHLVEWVNNSFDAEGDEIWPSEKRGIVAPERSATGLSEEERRDLLGMAMSELPLPEKPDWESAEDVAAFRAVYLAIITDWREDLWIRVAELSRTLARWPFGEMPSVVLSGSNLDWMFETTQTAGALRVAEVIANALLARCRARSEELGTPESRRDLSVSLDNVAGIERARGDLDAALAKYEESLEIRRALAEELGTPESCREVSLSLDDVGGIEQTRGDLDAALAKYEEIHQNMRALAEELGTPQSRRDVSVSLERVAVIEEARGDLGAALAKYEESLETRRALEEELGTPESRRDVSVSLNNVAGIEHARGDLGAALAKCEESLEIRRALAEELGTPGSRRDVSVSLERVAGIEHARGDLDAALAKYEESLEIRRALAEELGTPGSHRDVSESLNNVAGIEEARGDLDAALAKYEESLEIRRALAEELGTPESRRDVSVSLNKVAGVEEARGDLDAALAEYGEGLEIARALAEELGTPESRRDVSVSLNKVAGVEEARGDLDAALAKYEEIHQNMRALAEELGTPGSRRDLSVSLERVAGIEQARDDLDAALAKYEEALEISRALAEELGTPESRRDVSVSLNKVAGVEEARGDLDAALAKYEEIHQNMRALAEELGTPGSRRDLSVSLERVAGIEQARGDLDAALAKYEEALEISRALAEELSTPESRRDVSVSLERVARIEEARGDLGAALAKYEEIHQNVCALAEELGTPGSRRDVSVSLDNVAGIEEARGDLDAALAKYEEALEIRRALAEELGTPESCRDMSVSLDTVARIEEARGDLDAALAKYGESLEIADRLFSDSHDADDLNSVTWTVHLICDLRLQKGEIESADAMLRMRAPQAHQLAAICGADANMWDTCAAFWETTAKAAEALRDNARRDAAAARAAQIRADIASLEGGGDPVA